MPDGIKNVINVNIIRTTNNDTTVLLAFNKKDINSNIVTIIYKTDRLYKRLEVFV